PSTITTASERAGLPVPSINRCALSARFVAMRYLSSLWLSDSLLYRYRCLEYGRCIGPTYAMRTMRPLRSEDRHVIEALAAFHEETGARDSPDIFQWVAVHRDNVRILACFERAADFLHAADFRRLLRGCHQCLHRGETPFHQRTDLVANQAVHAVHAD